PGARRVLHDVFYFHPLSRRRGRAGPRLAPERVVREVRGPAPIGTYPDGWVAVAGVESWLPLAILRTGGSNARQTRFHLGHRSVLEPQAGGRGGGRSRA